MAVNWTNVQERVLSTSPKRSLVPYRLRRSTSLRMVLPTGRLA